MFKKLLILSILMTGCAGIEKTPTEPEVQRALIDFYKNYKDESILSKNVYERIRLISCVKDKTEQLCTLKNIKYNSEPKVHLRYENNVWTIFHRQ